jgi:hypothetical protein
MTEESDQKLEGFPTRTQPPWVSKRLDKAEDSDLTLLCLAIIAPVSPGHPDFEEVARELKLTHKKRRMRKKKCATPQTLDQRISNQ